MRPPYPIFSFRRWLFSGNLTWVSPLVLMGPINQRGMIRRKVVARRLRDFFADILGRFSGGSAELLDRAEKRSAASDPPLSEPTPKRARPVAHGHRLTQMELVNFY
jgi:hypothetical protein